MARPAHVTSIAALREFRVDLLAFAGEGKEALSANELELQRAFAWLDNQAQFWAREIATAMRQSCRRSRHCGREKS